MNEKSDQLPSFSTNNNLTVLHPDVYAPDSKKLDGIFDALIEDLCFIRRIPFRELTEAFERRILVLTLSRFNGSQKKTAEHLGIKTSTLNEKIKKHRILFRKQAM